MSIASILRGNTSEQYIGRHRRDTVHQVDADWTPLDAGTRQHLAPHHYADTALPAGVDQPTGHLDRDAIDDLRAARQDAPAQACGARAEVLAEMRGDLDATAPTEVIPAATGEQPDPGEDAVDQIFTDVMDGREQ